MKFKHFIYFSSFSAILLCSAVYAASIPGSDFFTGSNTGGIDATNWGTTAQSGTMAVQGASFGGNEFAEFYGTGYQYMTWLDSPTNSSDFSVSVGVTNTASTWGNVTGTGQYSNVGIEIYGGSVSESLSYYVSAYYYDLGGFASQDTHAIGSDSNAIGSLNFAGLFGNSNYLTVDFSAATQTFTLSYDNGTGKTAFVSYNIDGGASNSTATQTLDYGMSAGDSFEINLFASTNLNLTQNFQTVTADNFSIVPEPGTYALFFGIFAIAAVVFYRRRK